MIIATFSEFTNDFRAVLRRVTKPLTLYTISAVQERRKHLVFYISIFDEEIDGDKPHFEVTSREMKDNTGFYLRLTRDLMTNLLITVKGKESYFIETRPGALKGLAAKMGVTVEEYREIVLGGGLGDLIGGDPEAIKRKFSKRLKTAQTEGERKAARIAMLEEQIKAAERWRAEKLGELSALRDGVMAANRIRDARDARIAQLEAFVRDKGFEPPPYTQVRRNIAEYVGGR